jgi:hypothetical protein
MTIQEIKSEIDSVVLELAKGGKAKVKGAERKALNNKLEELTLKSVFAHKAERAANPKKQTVVLSLGMGVDSAAILARWILEPETRDFDLEDLIVLTSQTGNEFKEAPALCEKHLLPLMREHNIRFVQVAKGGLYEKDGIVILDDTTQPTTVFVDGHYKLSDEMTVNATVPTVKEGQRLCTLKFKGWVLDQWKDANVEGEYRHIIGFEANEVKRAADDQKYTAKGRTPEYTLIEWGWDRAKCEEYLEETFGEPWSKSCCTFCPFAKDHAIARYAVDAKAGAEALMIEHLSMALNPRMKLYGTRVKSLHENLEAAGTCDEAFDTYQAELNATEHTIYRIRRIYKGKANAMRSIVDLGLTGSREETLQELRRLATQNGTQVEFEGTAYRTYSGWCDGEAQQVLAGGVRREVGAGHRRRTGLRWMPEHDSTDCSVTLFRCEGDF